MTNWKEYGFSELFENVTSSSHKLKQSEYSTTGRYPVVDQGSEFIGGWSDDSSLVHPAQPPVVVYGDHTRVVKLLERRFIQGADGVKLLVPTEKISARFGAWLLRACPVPSRGYARHFSHLRKLRFLVPPLSEQDRIVSTMEALFSRLDAAVPDLARAQKNIERARQSVLRAAVEGRLVPTEAELARGEGREYEAADVLLERILEDQRTRHEKEQDAAKRKKKYKGPVEPDTEGLPALPEGWAWASVNQITQILDRLRVPVKRAEREARLADTPREDWVPYYGATGQAGWIDEHLFDEPLVLLGEDGVPFLDPLKPKAYRINGKSWVNNHAHVLRTVLVLDPYLEAALNVADYKQITSGTTRLKLTQTAMRPIPIPLPPLIEQRRIVAALERHLSIFDALEATVKANLTRCERLRQAILNRAFEGGLVPPDGAAPAARDTTHTHETVST